MRAPRINLDFREIDLATAFGAYDDNGSGIRQRVLAGGLDREARQGCRTRLLRLEPGAETPAAHAHDYWEEIWMLEGAMEVGDPDSPGGWRRLAAPAYACREPGFMHGPVRAPEGCLLLEFSWYESRGGADDA